jgi:hypothetical protein
MNQTRTAARRISLAIVVVWIAGSARAGDVTVVSSVGQSHPPGFAEAFSPEEPPPLPGNHAAPHAGEFSTGAPLGSAVSPEGEPIQIETPIQSTEAVELAPRWFTLADRPLEASWYTRFDYFCWYEREGDVGLLDERSTLYNLGYVRSSGAQRARIELFTGVVHYAGATWAGDPLESSTEYLGFRGEYELHWDASIPEWPSMTCFAGIGTRFWIRDLKDGQLSRTGEFASGYQETWWTLYPYLGLEKRWPRGPDTTIFLSGRLGCTAYTSENVSMEGVPTLHPQPNVIGQVECGLQYLQFYFSAYFDAMSWQKSPVVEGVLQPASQMYTTGLKLGLVF